MVAYILSNDEFDKLKELKEYAERPENYYLADRGDPPPGDKEEYVRVLEAAGSDSGESHKYKVVFTITENKGKRFRQASFSVDGFKDKKFPHPLVIELFCHHLGYVGNMKNWIGYRDVDMEGAIVVCQVLEDVT